MALNNTYGARLPQQETMVGAGVQLLLLALLGTAIGLGPAGWLTGLAFGIATWAVLTRALRRTQPSSFDPPTVSPSAARSWWAASPPWSRTPSRARRR